MKNAVIPKTNIAPALTQVKKAELANKPRKKSLKWKTVNALALAAGIVFVILSVVVPMLLFNKQEQNILDTPVPAPNVREVVPGFQTAQGSDMPLSYKAGLYASVPTSSAYSREPSVFEMDMQSAISMAINYIKSVLFVDAGISLYIEDAVDNMSANARLYVIDDENGYELPVWRIAFTNHTGENYISEANGMAGVINDIEIVLDARSGTMYDCIVSLIGLGPALSDVMRNYARSINIQVDNAVSDTIFNVPQQFAWEKPVVEGEEQNLQNESSAPADAPLSYPTMSFFSYAASPIDEVAVVLFANDAAFYMIEGDNVFRLQLIDLNNFERLLRASAGS